MSSETETAAKLEIMELTHKVARGVDRKDVDLFCDCFIEGAHFDAGLVSGQMPDVGRQMFEIIGDSMRRTQHAVSNHIILLDGDTAKCEAQVIGTAFFDVEGEEMELVFGGRYLDEFRRNDGVWKLSARRILVDYARNQKSTHSDAGAYEGTTYKGTRDKNDPSYKFVF
ncbi:hypothetical protein GCM10011371_25440 [Novosphingobium marinum]|uniref:SnoaL-like domain-containing protein n=1 Tax=Novosphingobium marinum TaxID=1514948 RepID=A0A7Y9XUH3_9SPHN|nr:nuclear transport factor 2 family protein [Novosphingobium marinum]NYH94841.1 hypothetical protein [Novosphingobium marinum]GGC36952.1 hypothetical protein GCM10011371_25440 [Novosphingobium marinum]